MLSIELDLRQPAFYVLAYLFLGYVHFRDAEKDGEPVHICFWIGAFWWVLWIMAMFFVAKRVLGFRK
jgi:MFS-type transporter involved in bile tolerance (Atg22 family)